MMQLTTKLAKTMTTKNIPKQEFASFESRLRHGIINMIQRLTIEYPDVLGTDGTTSNLLEKILKASCLDKSPFNSQLRFHEIIDLE
jgi:hypothetical protein